MPKYLALLGVAVLTLGIASTGWTVDTWDTYNELANPCFVFGGSEWNPSGNMMFNGNGTDPGGVPVFGRGHIAYDPNPPGTPPGQPSGWLRQIVNDSLSPGWNPALNQKFFRFTASVYTTGNAYILFGVDWWTDNNIPKPLPGTPADGAMWSQPITSLGGWTEVTWEGYLPYQPKWVSVEVAYYGCSGTGQEAAVDEMAFYAKCVPEPSSILGLASGVLALAGFAFKRRIR
ncbi:MAG: PEP-CTERM sorting domain-containing protein [Alphaproteobacteria bacterium]|nr:PEP-CTERM sorting domain-containing protein [Alphaproteobacteria bacterium]